MHTQLIISGKSVSQCTSYSLIFSLLNSIINREQHENHLYNQSNHYECLMVNVHTPVIDIKVGMSL